jgi:hypothetical protein
MTKAVRVIPGQFLTTHFGVKHCIHNGYSSAFVTQIYVKGLGQNKFL